LGDGCQHSLCPCEPACRFSHPPSYRFPYRRGTTLVPQEILEKLVELMQDPFGNYLIQKLLDRCSEEQRLQVLRTVAEHGELVNVALNTHGTRAVQKLIETLTSREQVGWGGWDRGAVQGR
jgi:hypothetical protein